MTGNRGEPVFIRPVIEVLGLAGLLEDEHLPSDKRIQSPACRRSVHPGRRDDLRGSEKVNVLSATDMP